MSRVLEVISLLQEQNKELQSELTREQSEGRQRNALIESQARVIRELHSELDEESKKVGEDIQAFYNKAKAVIESQFGLGIKMRPGDLIKLWLNFLRIAQLFTCEATTSYMINEFEHNAYNMVRQMVERGDLMLETNQLGDMLERIVYPYITVNVGGETITWKELREKYR